MPTKGFLSTWVPLVIPLAMTIPQQRLIHTYKHVPWQYEYKKTKITYSYSTIENKNVEKIKMSKRSSQILNWKGMNYEKSLPH